MLMRKLYRFELECFDYHRWITSPTESECHQYDCCPICGGALRGFEKYNLTEKFSFLLESAEKIDFKDKLIDEGRYYVAIQNNKGEVVARQPKTYSFDDAVSVISKIKDVNQKMLLKLLRSKEWSVYVSD